MYEQNPCFLEQFYTGHFNSVFLNPGTAVRGLLKQLVPKVSEWNGLPARCHWLRKLVV